jgi:hypothetical protein
MSEENVEVVRQIYAARERDDQDGLTGFMNRDEALEAAGIAE